VRALDDAIYRPPIARRELGPSEIAVLSRNSDGTFDIPLPPPRKIAQQKDGVFAYDRRCNTYIVTADLGRHGAWSKIGIAADMTNRARAIRRSIAHQPLYLVAWWSFTSHHAARRLELAAIEQLRMICGATFPEDWFPLDPVETARRVAKLAEDFSAKGARADCFAIAEAQVQYRPVP